MKRWTVITAVAAALWGWSAAAGPAGNHCDPGDTHFVELKNTQMRYCVTDHGWSHAWYIPGTIDPQNDRFSGDDAVALRYTGVERKGWLTRCLDREDDFIGDRGHPTDAGSADPHIDSPWEVIDPVAKVAKKNTRCRSKIRNMLNKLEVAIDTTISTNGLDVRQTYTVTNPAGNATTFQNLDLIDYMHAHTPGTTVVDGVAYHPDGVTQVQYELASDSIVFSDIFDSLTRPRLVMTGNRTSTKHDCGFVRPGAQPQPLWKLVETGALQDRNAAAFGDVGGALQWRLANTLAPGASASMTVIKYVPTLSVACLGFPIFDELGNCCTLSWRVTNHSNQAISEFYLDLEAGDGAQTCMDIADITPPPGFTAEFCYPWDESAPSNWAVVRFSGGTIAARSNADGEIEIDVNGPAAVEFADEDIPGWGAFTVPPFAVHIHTSDVTPDDLMVSCPDGEYGPHIKEQAFLWSPGEDCYCDPCYFDTASQSVAFSPEADIPDNNAGGVTDTQTINSNGPVYRLEVGMGITHSVQGDLSVRLKHVPSGTEVVLVDRPGFPLHPRGFTADNYGCGSHFILNDRAPNIYDEPAQAFPGQDSPCLFRWKPENALSAFDGLDRAGPWELKVIDHAAGDAGTLDGWSLGFADAGACCVSFPDCVLRDGCRDVCLVRTECECFYQERGEYLGNSVACTPNPCVDSCCLAGFCEEMEGEECLSLGGTPMPGTPCEEAGCTTNGACCLSNGACQDDQSVTDCALAGGTYQGDASTCESLICPALGACCLDSFGCIGLVTLLDCVNSNGDYQGDLSDCGSVQCVEVGACCLASGDCYDRFSGDLCDLIDGAYQGDQTYCDGVSCPQPPTGACCFYDGSCVETLSQDDCLAAAGDYQGDGVSCSGQCLVFPTGACCITAEFEGSPLGASCEEATFEGDCAAEGGDWGGPDSLCAEIECPPTGACCESTGTCMARTHVDCVYDGGVYLGDAAECGGDCNSNGFSDVCDIAAGSSVDCDGNGTPDECQLSPGEQSKTYSQAPSLVLPDVATVSTSMTVPDSGSITDLDVNVELTHTWVGDLVVRLSHGATTIDLWRRQCGSADNMDIFFDDEGASVVCPATTGNLRYRTADQLLSGGPGLSAFDGMDKAGLWTLTISDQAGGDTGVLTRWSLSFIQGQPGAGADCNSNGLLDECDLVEGLSADCDTNGTPDECQIGGDCDASGTLDTCELAGNDCNNDGGLDSCDIASGTSQDCNANAAPDECDIAGGSSEDCNLSGVPDECDVLSNDCNSNGTPDDCELAGNDCQPNGVPDGCDVAFGTSADANGNATPDECEGGPPAATAVSLVSRRANPSGPGGNCDAADGVGPFKVTESHSGGANHVRILFDVAPGGGGSGWTLEQATCSAPGYVPSPAQGTGLGSVVSNELVIVFSPALPNARTYRITLGPTITSVAGQSGEVRVLTGDATANGRVDAADRSAIVGVWTGVHFSCPTDITNSGQTNAADRSAVVGAWTNPAANCAP